MNFMLKTQLKLLQDVLSELFEQGYNYIDVTLLFTNGPLNRKVKLIIKHIYNDNLIPAHINKRTMKKLVIVVYTKTVFYLISKSYMQISMGFPLGSILANIIITELESTIVKKLFD